MPTEMLMVLGAGGHAKVVIDAWLQGGGLAGQVAVFDDDPELGGRPMAPGVRVSSVPLDRSSVAGGRAFHVAVGNNQVRDGLLRDLTRTGGRAMTVIHPDATSAASAEIAEGVFVAARALVGPAAVLAAGAILNHGCIVDHDCRVGAAAHIAPGAILGGAVVVGARVLVGAGAVILPGLHVGDDAVIGAGAVVTKDVAARCTMRGVPARSFQNHA